MIHGLKQNIYEIDYEIFIQKFTIANLNAIFVLMAAVITIPTILAVI